MIALREAVQSLALAREQLRIAKSYATQILGVAVAQRTVQEGITHSELAERAGVSKQRLSDVVLGRQYSQQVADYLLGGDDA